MKYILILVFSLSACAHSPVSILDLSGVGKGASDYWVASYRAPPVYPSEALDKGVIGCVLLRHVISSSGESNDIQVINSVPNDVFDQSAVRALSQYQWVPTAENKERRPVKSDWLLNFATTDNPKAPSCVLLSGPLTHQF